MKKFIGILLWAAVCLFALYLRFTNIDMTEMRLFLTYWKEFSVCCVLLIIGALFVKSHRSDNLKGGIKSEIRKRT